MSFGQRGDTREAPTGAVLIVTEVAGGPAPADLAGKARDTLPLTWEERRWTRKRAVTAAGRLIALALPTGSVLRDGDVLAVGEDWYLAVVARAEPVLALRPRDRAEAVRVAYEVGNRHFALALDGEAILVPDDAAMAQLAGRLGVAWERRLAVFEPLGGAPRALPGASPLDGHTHGGRHHRHG